MVHLYLKAIHIIFVVSWFAGLFYIVRLFIYHVEAFDKEEPESSILHKQFVIMERRLMHIITTPSMLLTIFTGIAMIVNTPGILQGWLILKIFIVFLVVLFHVMCVLLMRGLKKEKVLLSSTKLRMFNELATILLVAIVFLVVLRTTLDMFWGVLGIVILGVIMLIAVKLYKKRRENGN